MKNLFYKTLLFVAGTMRSDSNKSSKRLFGSIGFICSIVFIGIWEHDLINELLYVSAGLLGLETVFKLFNTAKRKK